MKLIKKEKLRGKIICKSGLHIGDSKESAEIGGLDSPVMRRKYDNTPYIPGSSIKGKIRSLLEISRGEDLGGDNIINQYFGITSHSSRDGNSFISRFIFRDAYLTKTSKSHLDEIGSNLDLPYTEIKYEVSIDRVEGSAKDKGLRNIERVPAGAIFEFEIIVNVFEGEEGMHEELLKEGFNLLENDYLGGNGTRGYGQVKIELNEPVQVYPKSQSE